MLIGKVYRYKDDSVHCLSSGSSVYPYAICVSYNPFVLVSEHGDMLWQTTIESERADFVELDIVINTFAAFKRYYGKAYNCVVIKEET